MRLFSLLFQRSHIFIFILFCLALVGIEIWSTGAAKNLKKPVRGNLFKQEVKPAEKPVRHIKRQPNSPLQMTIVRTENANLNTPEFIIRVTNRSDKPIVAYAIRYENLPKTSSAGGSELSVAASSDSVLLPHNSQEIDIGNGTVYSDPVKKIIVSVDFIEFIDGVRWGPDHEKSAERLDGQRAGIRAVRDSLLTLLKLKGATTVMSSLEDIAIMPPPGVSRKYEIGFRSGVGLIKAHLRNTYKNGGDSEIETIIRQSFDASQETRK